MTVVSSLVRFLDCHQYIPDFRDPWHAHFVRRMRLPLFNSQFMHPHRADSPSGPSRSLWIDSTVKGYVDSTSLFVRVIGRTKSMNPCFRKSSELLKHELCNTPGFLDSETISSRDWPFAAVHCPIARNENRPWLSTAGFTGTSTKSKSRALCVSMRMPTLCRQSLERRSRIRAPPQKERRVLALPEHQP